MKKPFYSGYSYGYPDTSIILNSDTICGPIYQSWKNNGDSVCYEPYLGNWNDFFYKKDSDYKLILFIFNADTLEKYPWEQIRRENKIHKRFMYTKKQLDSMNWRVNIN